MPHSTPSFPPSPELHSALEEIYKYLLQETARDTLNRQLRSGVSDDQLAALIIDLRADNRLCQVQEQQEPEEPQHYLFAGPIRCGRCWLERDQGIFLSFFGKVRILP